MHCHPQKKTSLIVLNGEVYCKNLKNNYLRTKGEAIQIDKKVFQNCTNKLPLQHIQINTKVLP